MDAALAEGIWVTYDSDCFEFVEEGMQQFVVAGQGVPLDVFAVDTHIHDLLHQVVQELEKSILPSPQPQLPLLL